jgi:hypothetical protein
MKRVALTVLLLSVSTASFAFKPCDELKSEIQTKLDAKGVVNYALEVVAAADVGEQKVVGSCEGGSKKIVYSRTQQ